MENVQVSRACVIFSTRYGNTEDIARALARGLAQSGIKADCLNVNDVPVGSLGQYDLLCVGAPTEAFSAARQMKDFLKKLKGANLSGKHFFAFDTHVSPGIFGSGAKYIENELKKLKMKPVAKREGAIVRMKGTGTSGGAELKEGEEKRFEQIGAGLGRKP